MLTKPPKKFCTTVGTVNSFKLMLIKRTIGAPRQSSAFHLLSKSCAIFTSDAAILLNLCSVSLQI